ncbi:hypothetical protein HGM15179_000187, partial [Zosterops borbonicus]
MSRFSGLRGLPAWDSLPRQAPLVQIAVKLNQPLVHIVGRLIGLQTSFTTKISDH